MSQSKLKQVFSYQSWVHAVSGSAGSVIAMSAFYPLDTVRSRLQLEEPDRRKALSTWRILMHLIEEEGFATLYRGLVPVLQSLCISNFVYFYTFHSLKALRAASAAAGGGPGAGQSALGDLLLGSLAGVVNVLTTTPFWVVNTRLKMKGIDQQQQQQRLLGGTGSSVRNGGNHSNNHRSIGIGNSVKYDGLLDGLQYIARTEGIRGLWAGAVPSLLLVINPAIQFMVYEALKRKLTEGRHPASSSSPSAITFFSIGAIAKMIATVLTYPLQLVQTKLRHGNADKSLNLPADIDTVQLLLIILKRQGVAGLYRGLEAKLLQTVLTAALMFMAYEKIARFVTSLLISPKNVKGLH